MYYFDNAATTKVLKPAADLALKCMTQMYGNPSSLHKMGLEAEEILDFARKSIADVLNCEQGEIIFTSCATESVNIALFGSLKNSKHTGEKIITTSIEHASTAKCVEKLEEQGYGVVRISSKDVENFSKRLINEVDEKTFLISLIHVNNENGLILPIEEIAKQAKLKNPNLLIHVDIVQSFCKMPLDLSKLEIDLASFSGHKINAPKGVGGLYIRKGTKILKRSFGGGQENNFRPGTEAVPAIAAFGVAAKINRERMDDSLKHYYSLKNHLMSKIKDNSDIYINSPAGCAPYIVNVSIKGIRSEIMLHFLEQNGFIVSSGSACSGSRKSGVLQSMGYSKAREDCSIRISFSTQNTISQIDMLVDAIKQGQKKLIKSC